MNTGPEVLQRHISASASKRGVWTLTDQGRTAQLDASGVHLLFKAVHRQFTPSKQVGKPNQPESLSVEDEEESPEAEAASPSK